MVNRISIKWITINIEGLEDGMHFVFVAENDGILLHRFKGVYRKNGTMPVRHFLPCAAYRFIIVVNENEWTGNLKAWESFNEEWGD